MKILSKLLLPAIVLTGVATACLKYDDAGIRHDLDELDKRLTAVEELVNTFNNNIASVQSLVNSMNGMVFVSSVTETSDGYVINFSDGKVATIRNGVDGETPSIGIKQDSDGEWYWTINGEWLLGSDWNKVRVSGRAPQLKIEDDYWFLSTDGGNTWTRLEKAVGKDGDPTFASVTYDDSFVYFVMQDGTEFKVGRGASSVQVISVIPDYIDGSVEARAGEFPLRFMVAPLSAAQSISVLSDNYFSLKAVYTQTKASSGEMVTLPVISKSVSGDILTIIADGNVLGEVFGSISYGASASLTIDDGLTAVSSGFFPLYDDAGKKNGHAYADLGLSVLWASCNIGAGAPEESGNLFAWGETVSKSVFNWDNYLWGDPPAKYKSDGRDQLELTDDAANVIWGGSWRMPTKAEMDELCNEDNCAWSWTTQNGVNGYRVISKKSGYAGNSIFLPAAGRQWKTSAPTDVNAIGSYWSATANLDPNYPNDAYIIYIVSQNYPKVTNQARGAGLSIRPVCAK